MTGPLNVGDVIGNRYEIESYIDEGGCNLSTQLRTSSPIEWSH